MHKEECSPAIKNNRRMCANPQHETHTTLLRNPDDEAGERIFSLLSRKGRK